MVRQGGGWLLLVLLSWCCQEVSTFQLLPPRSKVITLRPSIISLHASNSNHFNSKLPQLHQHQQKTTWLQTAVTASKLLSVSMVLQLVFVQLFGIHPATAAAASTAIAGGGNNAKKAILPVTSLGIARKPAKERFVAFLRKLFQGANAKGKLGALRVGDTRSELSSMFNVISMVGILSLCLMAGFVLERKERFWELRRMKQAVAKEQEYREDMYIEAVDEIMKKLTSTQLKPSVRTTLLAELKDLDPEGKIRDFLSGKLSQRPSLNLGDKPAPAASKKPAPPQQQQSPSKSKLNPRGSNSDNTMNNNVVDNNNNNKPGSAKKVNSNNGNNYGSKKSEEDVPSRTRASSPSSTPPSSQQDKTGPPPPSNKPPAGSKAEKAIEAILHELNRAVATTLAPPQRKKLIQYVHNMLEKRAANTEQLRTAINSIQSRLKDSSYWIQMYERFEDAKKKADKNKE